MKALGRAETHSIPSFEVKDKLCLIVNVRIVFWKQHKTVWLLRRLSQEKNEYNKNKHDVKSENKLKKEYNHLI
jgi:hypothetical protein